MYICNGVMDVLNSSSSIYWQPVVPPDNLDSYNIKVLSFDESPLPKYPEDTNDGLKR